MVTLFGRDRRLPFGAFGLVIFLSVCCGPAGIAGDEGVSPGFFQQHSAMGYGSLSYGGYAMYPGFPGFGLSFHPGYGYGGNGLGVGAFGGYPFYGGPGYPHPAPVLRRCGGIALFLFYGGPGYPRLGDNNYFAEVGPLVIRQPVVVITPANAFGYSGDFGPFTGTLPYPDSYFAPFVEAAAKGATTERRDGGAATPARQPSAPAP